MQQQLARDIQLVFKQLSRWLWSLLLILPLLYMLSGFYSVGIDQRAYVTRLGKLIQDNVSSGMHYHLPWPIEAVTIADIPSLKSQVIEFIETQPKRKTLQLITGNGNLVDSQVEIQYSVIETQKYLGTAKATDRLLEALAKSEIIYHVSHNQFENLLTTGRNQFQERIKSNLQRSTEELALGLRITGVQIKLLEPPQTIKKAFDDISSAQSEKQKLIQEARGERGTRLSAARSESNREKSDARALANELGKRAEGDVKRFQSQLEALNADKLYLQRLYFENLEAIFAKAKVDIIAPEP
ncbi:MAG: protease modulator HflK [Cellvibrionaceae bacterium]|nr:protease modulator HflK [Cellvibrionaceae bacterium]